MGGSRLPNLVTVATTICLILLLSAAVLSQLALPLFIILAVSVAAYVLVGLGLYDSQRGSPIYRLLVRMGLRTSPFMRGLRTAHFDSQYARARNRLVRRGVTRLQFIALTLSVSFLLTLVIA